jgi:multisubunit Na+/H+ antiporter MnhC subunit
MLPPPMVPSYQMMQDAEHLKLLSVFYYISSGLSCLGCLFGLFYVAIGLIIPKMVAPIYATSAAPPFPQEMTWIFLVIGIAITVLCIVITVCQFLTARWLSARKNKTFCMVIAGITCIYFPIGTTLGVFTFMVVTRPSVASLFNHQSPLTSPQA